MIPFSTFTERAEAFLRMIPAYIIVALLFIFGVVSVSYPFTGLIKAPFFLMGLYYWSIYRPTLLPRWLVFTLGCLMDVLSGFPIGINALLFLIFQWIVGEQRKILMAQPFLFVWFGFFMVAMSSVTAQWAAFSLIDMHLHAFKPLITSALLGTALFPLIGFILHFTHKFLPESAFQLRM